MNFSNKPIMKLRPMPVKRKPLKRGLFRTLHARIGGKTHKAATTADPSQLTGDIPNMNVGRALIVIAVLHVLGIGGVFLQKHYENKMTSHNPGESPPPGNPTAVAGLTGEKPKSGALTDIKDLPQIQKNDGRHMVVLGDTYESVAHKWGINVETLRKANNSVPLCSGLVLRVPPREIVALDPPEMAALRKNQQAQDDVPAGSAQVPRAIRVTPNHNYQAVPKATPVDTISTANPQKYKVKKGDTVNMIARRYGISTSQLMKYNGIGKSGWLKEGQTLKIPAKTN
jgi:LysM repeat protein